MRSFWGVAMDAEVGDESDLIVDSGGYGEPVEVLQDGCDPVNSCKTFFVFSTIYTDS